METLKVIAEFDIIFIALAVSFLISYKFQWMLTAFIIVAAELYVTLTIPVLEVTTQEWSVGIVMGSITAGIFKVFKSTEKQPDDTVSNT